MERLDDTPNSARKKPHIVNEWEFYFIILAFSAVVLALVAGYLVKNGLFPSVAIVDTVAVWMLIAMAAMPLLFRFVRQMSVVHLLVLALSLSAFFVGHFKLAARDMFPMMSWFIFTGPKDFDQVTCRQMIGVFKDGKEKRLLVEQIFPSIVQFNLPVDFAGKRAPGMAQIIDSIGQEYNRLHPENPVIRVDLREVSVPIRPTPSQNKPVWTSLESYPISSAPSKS